MDRRQFLHTAGASGLVSSVEFPILAEGKQAAPPGNQQRQPKTMVFWDLWHLERFENLHHRQGQPQWRSEYTYIDPQMFGLNSWATVYRDQAARQWRMLYSALWKPFSLMVAQSEDGLRWQPSPQPNIRPEGRKLAANHVFTLEDGSAGGVYHDPVASDGFPFKVFCRQHGQPVLRRALADKNHLWHAIASREGLKRYMSEALTLASRDGLNWSIQPDGDWAIPHWYPEPPLFGFYNRQQGKHAMTVRPGWGDRRVTLQTTENFRDWSGPEMLVHPDPQDGIVEFYGMPVFPYATGYVGLLWVFHCGGSESTRSFNRFVGSLDCQLAYSYDGLRFFRAFREPFIGLNPPGEHGCSAIQPSCLVETDNEIRIYSNGSKIMHGMSRHTENARNRQLYSILVHTLRKDGLTYISSERDWGYLQTKPLVLLGGNLAMNAQALHGEIQIQVADIENQPFPGFTFDDFVAFRERDSLTWPLAWRNRQWQELHGRVIRLQVRLRNARFYSFRGDYHFLDAQDMWLLRDEKEIDPSLFDF